MLKALPLHERLTKFTGESTRRFRGTNCLEWTGAKDARNYGRITVALTPGGPRKSMGAHRFAYLLQHGEIPDDLTIDHLCRNTLCVNHLHLEAVTMKVNGLRGTSPTAVNARKTRCSRNHPLEGDNLWIEGGKRAGKRRCRACTRFWNEQRKKKGRAKKLTATEVIEIRALYDAGATQMALAKRFGVHQGTISSIIRRRTWAHI